VRNVVEFAVLGLGAGAIYALLAQGIVLIYRASGVLNFAQGAMAMAGSFMFYDFTVRHHWGSAQAFVVSVLLCALLGMLIFLFIMRPLRAASSLARLIATLGILVILESAATIRYTASTQFVSSWLPSNSITLPGQIVVGRDRLYLAAIVTACAVLLGFLSRRTRVGLATTGMAENPRAAATVGWSPDLLGLLTWSIGTGLAGAAGILIIPITGLSVDSVTWIVVPAMAAALIGGFNSFGLTLLGGLGIGILQSEVSRYVHTEGAPTALPLVLIILVLVVRGKSLPLRGHLLDRLPQLGTGRFRLGAVVPVVAVVAVAMIEFPDSWVSALTVSCIAAILLLSVVVLTGYAGQLSLAQYALAGTGALVAAHMVIDYGLPFELAIVIGVGASVVFGVLFSLPALRTRGVNLAIVTLGMGVAIRDMVFNTQKYSGIFSAGLDVGNQTLFGIHLNAAVHPTPYALVTLGFLVVSAWVVCNVRRGTAGRRLIAVRTNERAAASLGISVFKAKIYAFAVSAGLAGLAGILLAFTSQSINFAQTFDPLLSITIVLLAVVGGVGYVIGPLFGATIANDGFPGGIIAQHFGSGANWLALIGGVIVIVILVQDPNGMARPNILLFRRVAGKIVRKPAEARIVLPTAVSSVPRPIEAGSLEVRNLTVRFGGVVAIENVSLTLSTGEVVGLIGPNGAGKTSFIDAVTGFTRPSSGEVWLNGVRVDRWAPHRRARAGITRSFQSLELFDDISVMENIRAASDAGDDAAYFTSLVRPLNRPLSASATAAIRAFRLEDDLLRRPDELSYGRRRLVAIVRAAATSPSFLLLDEPAAGVGEMESAEVGELIRYLAREGGLGILLVEHDVSLVMNTCDRISVLDFGKTIAEGTPDMIRNNRSVIAAYLGVESEGEVSVGSGPPIEGHDS
jgi:ABC-type branched-subunit amino acid transport system ATPase component/ABC-type branched-subunit amino acid transport system permease subunit